MEKRKLNVLVGIDVYLPDTDGVINCMKNYIINSLGDVNITAIAPKNKKSHVDNLPYTIHRCKSMFVPFLNQYYGLPASDRKFAKKVRATKYDIVHIHSPFNMCKFATKIAMEQNIPIVGTFHSNFRMILQDVLSNKTLAESIVKSIGKAYSKMDEVFVCSEGVAEQIRSYGYKGKISYLPFGTELEKVDDVAPLKEEANKVFGLSPDEFLAIYVGRVVPLKRIDFILKALQIVKKKGKKFKFYIVGKGMDLKRLKRLSTRLGLDDRVKFLGFVPREQFPLINARADILLFPSIYDNFGLVKVEAAAYKTAGLFIKGTNAGDGITDGENGFLSDDNIEAFAEKIIYCIDHKDEMGRIGQNAQDTLYLHWRDATKEVVKKYYEIVENWQGRPENNNKNKTKSNKKSSKKISLKQNELEPNKKIKLS